MKCRFSIVGLATGGDEIDIKQWLQDAIIEHNKDWIKVVDMFNVQVEEVDDFPLRNELEEEVEK